MNEFSGQRVLDEGTTPREILMSDQTRIDRVGPCVIDSTNSIDGSNTGRTDEIRAGTLMAKVTATGKWVPMKRTTVTNTGTLTALVVGNAALFKVGDVISVGADTGITVTAIDYTTNTLTIASTAVVAGEDVICTSVAGSETARAVLGETVRLLSGVQFSSDSLDKQIKLLVGGYVNASYVIGDLTAARADTAAKLGGFVWSDQN